MLVPWAIFSAFTLILALIKVFAIASIPMWLGLYPVLVALPLSFIIALLLLLVV